MSECNLVRQGVSFRIGEREMSHSTTDALESPEECNGDHQYVNALLTSAPKGKPKAPPLIHEKVKPEPEDLAPAKSGNVPLQKSKSASFEFKKDLSKRTNASQASSGSQSGRSKASNVSKTSTGGRSFEKVRVSKGIEMKRVMQDSSSTGIKSMRFNSTPTTTHHRSGATMANSQSGSFGPPSSRSKKMTKNSALCPEVKVKRFLDERTSLSSTSVRSKPTASSSLKVNIETNEIDATPPAPPPTKVDELTNILADTCHAGASLEDFLKMPETNLPETQSQSQTSGNKKQLYKSKFWDYISNSSSKSQTNKSKKDQKKPYNPDEVKSFIQKQKESRREMQIKQSKAKQEEHEKRQRMLKDLENRYLSQRMSVKGKSRASEPNVSDLNQEKREEQNRETETCPVKKSKLEMESPSLKYLKPLLERKHGTSFLRRPDGKSETAKQAQYLLSEFENIVKRECISFLSQIPKPIEAASNTGSPVSKVDKSVGTNTSFIELNVDRKEVSESELEEVDGENDKPKYPPSPRTVIQAATKIQAAYRGYAVRKALKEANINLRKPFYKLLEPRTDKKNRRWSLSGVPEKPYTPNLSKVLPMSPIPVNAGFNPFSVPCYIPPPPPVSQSSRSPTRPRVLPTVALTPVRQRIYDEPYPRHISTPTQTSSTGNQNQNISASASSAAKFRLSRKIESLPLPQLSAPDKNVTISDFDLTVPSSLPSVLDAFREKLNLFKSELQQQQEIIAPKVHGINKTAPAPSKTSPLTTYTTDFESVSSETGRTDKSGKSVTSEEFVETPKLKPRKRRSRSEKNLQKESSPSNSATTVETEADYASSRSQSHSISKRLSGGESGSGAITNSNSEVTNESTSYSYPDAVPTTSNSLGGLLAPALQLRYEAERERLKVLEKALHVSLKSTNVKGEGSSKHIKHHHHHHRQHSSPPSSDYQKDKTSTSTNEEHPQKIKSSESVQYAIAKVQKESMRAAAEMAKWMAEFQKSSQEQDKVQAQKSTVDLAAMVYAAVEEARQIGQEKRREKIGKPKKEEHSSSRKENSSDSSNAVNQTKFSPRNAKVVEKVDKCVETSLVIVPEKNVGKAKNVESTQSRKDYQQQFPSDSERTTPIPQVTTRDVNFSIGAWNGGEIFAKPISSSRQEVAQAESSNHFFHEYDESLEYPSIIPSGNSVEITSLDPKVSSLQEGSYSVSFKTEVYETNEQLSASEHSQDIQTTEKDSKEGGVERESDVDDVQFDADEQQDSVENSILSASFKTEGVEDHVESEQQDELPYESVEDLVESEKQDELASESVDDLVESEKQDELPYESVDDLVESEKQDELPYESVDDLVESEKQVELPYESLEKSESMQSPRSGLETMSLKPPIPYVPKQVEVTSSVVEENIESDSFIQYEASVEDDKNESEKNDSISVAVTEQEKLENDVEDDDVASKGSRVEVEFDKVTEEESEVEETFEKVLTEEDEQRSEQQDFEENSVPPASHETEVVEDLVESEKQVELPYESVEESGSVLTPKSGLETMSLKPPPPYVPKQVEVTTPVIEGNIESESTIQDEASIEDDKNESEKNDSISVSHVSLLEQEKFENDVEDDDAAPKGSNVDVDKVVEEKTGEIEESLEKVLTEDDVQRTEEQDSVVNSILSTSNKTDVVEDIVESEQQEPNESMEESECVQSSKTELETIPLKPPPPYVSKQVEVTTPVIEENIESESSIQDEASVEDEKIESEKNNAISASLPEQENFENEHQEDYDAASKGSRFEVDEVSEKKSGEVVETLEKVLTDDDVQQTEPEVPIFTSKPQHMVQLQDQTLELEIPMKPPPPYSPSSSLDSTSISSRSLMIGLAKEKLETIIEEQADIMWTAWTGSDRCLPDINVVLGTMHSAKQSSVEYSVAVNELNSSGNLESLNAAIENFDALLWHLVYETLKEILQGENHSSTYIERVRPGPLALAAQSVKVPRSKQDLIIAVGNKVMKTIPSNFFSDMSATDGLVENQRKSKKWCSRPRELVDEILLEELEKENYQWTEWWPEEKIIINNATNNIIKSLIRNALEKRNYVYEQGWAKYLNFKYDVLKSDENDNQKFTSVDMNNN